MSPAAHAVALFLAVHPKGKFFAGARLRVGF